MQRVRDSSCPVNFNEWQARIDEPQFSCLNATKCSCCRIHWRVSLRTTPELISGRLGMGFLPGQYKFELSLSPSNFFVQRKFKGD